MEPVETQPETRWRLRDREPQMDLMEHQMETVETLLETGWRLRDMEQQMDLMAPPQTNSGGLEHQMGTVEMLLGTRWWLRDLETEMNLILSVGNSPMGRVAPSHLLEMPIHLVGPRRVAICHR